MRSIFAGSHTEYHRRRSSTPWSTEGINKAAADQCFFLFFKEAKYRQILTWRGKKYPQISTWKGGSPLLCLKTRVEKGQHRQKATYWSKYFHYKTLQTLIPLAMYDEPTTFPAARWLH
jgi:hypothetical protein